MGWETWWPLGSALQTSSCRKHNRPRAPATVLWHPSPRFPEARCPRLLLAYWAWQGYGADPILGHMELLCLPLWTKDSLTALPNPPFVMVPANVLCVSSLGSDLHCGLRSLLAWSGSQPSSQSEVGTGWLVRSLGDPLREGDPLSGAPLLSFLLSGHCLAPQPSLFPFQQHPFLISFALFV